MCRNLYDDGDEKGGRTVKDISSSRKNKVALTLLVVSALIIAIVFSLPIYEFNSCLYSKKSGNTFVGDEKYNAVLSEVNQVADEYRAQGFDVEISESVTERTNSKGETTSLITFKINQSFTKNGWSFLKSGLGSSLVLRMILSFLILAVLCAIGGTVGSLGSPYHQIDGRSSILRSAAAWFSLLAVLLIPVFVMVNTYTLSRRVGLYSSEAIVEGKEIFFAKLDSFLFEGTAGDSIDSVLKDLTVDNSLWIWVAVPAAFAMLLSAIQLRFGTIKHIILRGLLYAFVVIVCVITLYPYYVMLITGFRSNAETTDMLFLHVFPTKWVWSNLKDIVGRNVLVFLKNSLLISGGATLIAMLCGIPAAYSLARRRFVGKKVFLGFVIMSQMFSPVVLLIGIVQLMSALNLNDSIVGLMFINAAFNQAFAIWLLRGTFVSISSEMEQAALIDGCNTIQSLTKILIPMAAPGIVTALIFVFINAWNEFTVSTVIISTAINRPITVGITQFSSFNMIEWQYLFAASLLATIPVVILFMMIEKHLVSGLTSGGVKG